MITEQQKQYLILVQKKHHKKKELTHQQHKNTSKAKKLKLSQFHKTPTKISRQNKEKKIPGKSQGSHLQTSISRITQTSSPFPLIFERR